MKRVAIVRANWFVAATIETNELPPEDFPHFPAIAGTLIYEDEYLIVYRDGVGDMPPEYHWIPPANIADDHACNIISNMAMA